MGVATMEAMAMQVPVIATRVRGVPELVEHRHTGLLVEPQEPVQIADAIEVLLSKREFAVRLAHNGRTKVVEQFNASVEYARLVGIWTQCIVDAPIARCCNKARH